jgi:hypothetical protein
MFPMAGFVYLCAPTVLPTKFGDIIGDEAAAVARASRAEGEPDSAADLAALERTRDMARRIAYRFQKGALSNGIFERRAARFYLDGAVSSDAMARRGRSTVKRAGISSAAGGAAAPDAAAAAPSTGAPTAAAPGDPPAAASSRRSLDTSNAAVAALAAAKVMEAKELDHRERRFKGFALCSFGLALLVIYAGLVNGYGSNSADSGKYLGWATLAAVLVLDLETFLLNRGGLLSKPGPTCLLMLLSRFALVSFGAKWWFLGHSTVFLFYGCSIVHILAVKLRPLRPEDEPPEPPASERLSISACETLSELTRTPLFMLLSLTAAFVALIIAAALSTSGGLPLASVPGLTDGEALPQWYFGILAIVAVPAYFLAVLAVRAAHNWRTPKLVAFYDRAGYVYGGLLVGFLGAVAGVQYLFTKSVLIVVLGAFSPLCVMSLMYVYGRWRANDFSLLRPAQERRNTFVESILRSTASAATAAASDPAAGAAGAVVDATAIEVKVGEKVSTLKKWDLMGGRFDSGLPACGGGGCGNWRAGNFRRMWCLCAFFRCGLHPDDYWVIGALALFATSLAAMCATVMAVVKPVWVGAVILVGVVEVLLAASTVVQYFSTLEFRCTLWASALAALSMHTGIHLFFHLHINDRKIGTAAIAILFSWLLFPCLTALAAAAYKWADDRFQWSRFVVVNILLTWSCVLAFGAVFATYISIAGGAVIIVADCIGLFFVFIIGQVTKPTLTPLPRP